MEVQLMLCEKDVDRIESLKQTYGFSNQLGVIRIALKLLEKQVYETNLKKFSKINRWKHAAKLVAKSYGPI